MCQSTKHLMRDSYADFCVFDDINSVNLLAFYLQRFSSPSTAPPQWCAGLHGAGCCVCWFAAASYLLLWTRKRERERQVSFNRFSESSWWMYLWGLFAENILKQVFFTKISRGDADGCACLCMSMCGFDRGSRRELALPKSLDLDHTHTHTFFLLSFLPFKDFERRNRPMAEAPLPPVCVLSASSCPPLVD